MRVHVLAPQREIGEHVPAGAGYVVGVDHVQGEPGDVSDIFVHPIKPLFPGVLTGSATIPPAGINLMDSAKMRGRGQTPNNAVTLAFEVVDTQAGLGPGNEGPPGGNGGIDGAAGTLLKKSLCISYM